MINVLVTLCYQKRAGDYESVEKEAILPEVPRAGDYISVDELNAEMLVTETHFSFDGSVEVLLETNDPEDLQTLRDNGWTNEAT